MKWRTSCQSYSTTRTRVFPRTLEECPPKQQPYFPASYQCSWPQSEGFSYSFPSVFLRDSCSCVLCVDPSTTQKRFESADIPPDIHPASLDLRDDGSVQIKWERDIPGFDDHMSVYDPSFGDRNKDLQSRLEATSNAQDRRIPWDYKIISRKIETVDFSSYMNSPAKLFSSLEHLNQFGLLFLHSVPSRLDSVTAIAKKIGPLKETFYGSSWDVKSIPSAKNVAYTSTHLGFHMDLLYLDDPPGLQILHCLQASTQGGESLFSDALRAVAQIQKSRPDLYTILERFPVTYHYRNNHEYYQQTRPHIEVTTSPHDAWNYEGDPEILRPAAPIKAINWSPPFQAPFLVDIGDDTRPLPTHEDRTTNLDASQSTQPPGSEFHRYLEAIRYLKRELEADDAVFEQKMEPGTAVIFDNRRVVHARRAFENQGGERWLRGAYVNTDAFRSRLKVLKEEMS